MAQDKCYDLCWYIVSCELFCAADLVHEGEVEDQTEKSRTRYFQYDDSALEEELAGGLFPNSRRLRSAGIVHRD